MGDKNGMNLVQVDPLLKQGLDYAVAAVNQDLAVNKRAGATLPNGDGTGTNCFDMHIEIIARKGQLNTKLMLKYGSKNPQEFFAESFAGYILGSNSVWAKAMERYLLKKGLIKKMNYDSTPYFATNKKWFYKNPDWESYYGCLLTEDGKKIPEVVKSYNDYYDIDNPLLYDDTTDDGDVQGEAA